MNWGVKMITVLLAFHFLLLWEYVIDGVGPGPHPPAFSLLVGCSDIYEDGKRKELGLLSR